MIISVVLVWVVGLSLLGAWIVKWYAVKSQRFIDSPNARSSHTQPTPRGGGVAIVIAYVVGLLWVGLDRDPGFTWVAVGVGAWVAMLGFIDDMRGVSAGVRFLGQVLAAALILFSLGLPQVELFNIELGTSLVIYVVAGVGIVWGINLYNFMDGIDGIAAVQAITVAGSGAILYLLLGENQWAIFPILALCSTLGFAVFNWPPASIFMGDAGSGFLGLLFALLTLQAAWVEPLLLWAWLVLQAVFIVDASYTLLSRLLSGEKVYQPHRTHVYQLLAVAYKRHDVVTIGVLVVNTVILLPVAILIVLGKITAEQGMLGVYGTLIALNWYLRRSMLVPKKRRL